MKSTGYKESLNQYQDLVNQPTFADYLGNAFSKVGSQPAMGEAQRMSNAMLSGMGAGISGANHACGHIRLIPCSFCGSHAPDFPWPPSCARAGNLHECFLRHGWGGGWPVERMDVGSGWTADYVCAVFGRRVYRVFAAMALVETELMRAR